MRHALFTLAGAACTVVGYALGSRRRPMYTPLELDEMRSSLRALATPLSTSYNPMEVSARVDHQMLVHIANGTRPADLRRRAEGHAERQTAIWREGFERRQRGAEALNAGRPRIGGK